MHEDANRMVEIKRRVQVVKACCKRLHGPELYYMATARLSLKIRKLKAEVMKVLCCTGV